MEIEEHVEKLVSLVSGSETFPKSRERALNEALYAFSERGALGGVEIRDLQVALRIWALVERVKNEGFPDELRM